MIQGKRYSICTSCKIHHFDNCETCFGYGIKKKIFEIQDENIPVSAYDAECIRSGFILMWDYCPECHSSPYGLPKGIG